ncbi:hypothetical protein [Flavobacterium sp. N1994]|uniref:hypothetical protein n=1 Tax=Flavobacterium sp. N1994 TaxID=2986827 RepID=UPI0022225174|nr:hypothetical protein [Flavobacterium sp. N1994]
MKKSVKTNSSKSETSRTSVSETGHIKNVALFETLLAFCNGYGEDYNPANSDLLISNLQAKYDKSRQKLKVVKDTKQPYDSVVGERQMLFKPIKPYGTRVINALIAQKAPATVVKDARTIIRKLTGKRADNTPKDDSEQNQISVSQQSFDRLVDNFEELVVLAQTEGTYNPNEADLKTTALQSYLDSLNAINTRVRNALVPYSKALIARDKELYDSEIGLVDLAFEVKKYIKSVFGASSREYRQISGLRFTKPNKD